MFAMMGKHKKHYLTKKNIKKFFRASLIIRKLLFLIMMHSFKFIRAEKLISCSLFHMQGKGKKKKEEKNIEKENQIVLQISYFPVHAFFIFSSFFSVCFICFYIPFPSSMINTKKKSKTFQISFK